MNICQITIIFSVLPLDYKALQKGDSIPFINNLHLPNSRLPPRTPEISKHSSIPKGEIYELNVYTNVERHVDKIFI